MGYFFGHLQPEQIAYLRLLNEVMGNNDGYLSENARVKYRPQMLRSIHTYCIFDLQLKTYRCYYPEYTPGKNPWQIRQALLSGQGSLLMVIWRLFA